MKTTILITISLAALLLFQSCNDEQDTLNTDCKGESYTIEVLEHGSFIDGFLSNKCRFSNENSQYVVIQNDEDLINYLICEQPLIDIDFDVKTLLLGKEDLRWCCAQTSEQEVQIDCSRKIYNYSVTVNEPDGKYHALSTIYYWAVIDKIPSDYDVRFRFNED